MSSGRRRLILFTRFPIAGKVKTRLIPALGLEGAAALHRRLVVRTMRAALLGCREAGAELEVRFDGGSESAMRHWLGDACSYQPQGAGDLGQRMGRAVAQSFADGASRCVLIGSDCPELDGDLMAKAFNLLKSNSAVVGPAEDGGYYLLGLNREMPDLFAGIAWGTDSVLQRTIAVLARNGVNPARLKQLGDVDRPEDLILWERTTRCEESEASGVSVVIPGLTEA